MQYDAGASSRPVVRQVAQPKEVQGVFDVSAITYDKVCLQFLFCGPTITLRFTRSEPLKSCLYKKIMIATLSL